MAGMRTEELSQRAGGPTALKFPAGRRLDWLACDCVRRVGGAGPAVRWRLTDRSRTREGRSGAVDFDEWAGPRENRGAPVTTRSESHIVPGNTAVVA